MKLKDTQGRYNSLVIAGLLIAIVILIFMWQCGKNKQPPVASIRVDTVYVSIKQDTHYIPKLDTVYYAGKDKLRFKWDTIYFVDTQEPGLYIDTCNYSEFYATRIYRDTIDLSNGEIPFGNVVVVDTVSQNKIQGRRTKSNVNLPVVTKTVTLTQPKRAMVFIGANVLGSETDPLGGYGVNLSFKTKKDRMIEAGYNQLFGGQHYYSLGLKWKLSFRKQ